MLSGKLMPFIYVFPATHLGQGEMISDVYFSFIKEIHFFKNAAQGSHLAGLCLSLYFHSFNSQVTLGSISSRSSPFPLDETSEMKT